MLAYFVNNLSVQFGEILIAATIYIIDWNNYRTDAIPTFHLKDIANVIKKPLKHIISSSEYLDHSRFQKAIDEGQLAGAIFTNFSKAIDTITHATVVFLTAIYRSNIQIQHHVCMFRLNSTHITICILHNIKSKLANDVEAPKALDT